MKDLNFLSKRLMGNDKGKQNEFSFRNKTPDMAHRQRLSKKGITVNPKFEAKRPRHTAKAALIPYPYEMNPRIVNMSYKFPLSNQTTNEQNVAPVVANLSENRSNLNMLRKPQEFRRSDGYQMRRYVQTREQSPVRTIRHAVVRRIRGSSQHVRKSNYKHLKGVDPRGLRSSNQVKKSAIRKVRKISISHKKGIHDSEGKLSFNSTLHSSNSMLNRRSFQGTTKGYKKHQMLSRIMPVQDLKGRSRGYNLGAKVQMVSGFGQSHTLQRSRHKTSREYEGLGNQRGKVKRGTEQPNSFHGRRVVKVSAEDRSKFSVKKTELKNGRMVDYKFHRKRI